MLPGEDRRVDNLVVKIAPPTFSDTMEGKCSLTDAFSSESEAILLHRVFCSKLAS